MFWGGGGGLSARFLFFYLYQVCRQTRVLCGLHPTVNRQILCHTRNLCILRLRSISIGVSLVLGFFCCHNADVNLLLPIWS